MHQSNCTALAETCIGVNTCFDALHPVRFDMRLSAALAEGEALSYVYAFKACVCVRVWVLS
jgi:hypothetical protein